MRDAHFVLIKTAGLNLILSRGHPPVAGKEVFVLRRPPRRTALPSARLGGGKGYQAGPRAGVCGGREGAAVLHPLPTQAQVGGGKTEMEEGTRVPRKDQRTTGCPRRKRNRDQGWG